jgi:MFS family permease
MSDTATQRDKFLESRWADFFFSPSKFPFFYGWVIVAAGTVGVISSVPGQTIGVGVFTEYFIESMKISRTELSTAYMFGTVTSSLMLPFAGKMIDKLGTRMMGTLSAIFLGLSLLVISQCDKVPEVLNISSTPVIVAWMSLCFMLIRFFGQGCATMTGRVTIGKWFNHRRGLAVLIHNVFITLTFNFSPKFLNEMVTYIGWRETYIILAVVIGGGIAFLVWVFYRDNPEQCGLVMDGIDDPEWKRKMAEKVAEVKKQFTRREAIKTLSFWTFAAGCALQGMFMTAVTFHITSIGQEMGLSRDVAYSVFPVIAVIGVVSTVATGWISDRVRLKWLLFTLLLNQAFALLGLIFFDTAVGKLMLEVGFGVSSGIFGPLMTITLPRFFGRRHLGAITGLNTSILVFTCAIGPSLYSAVRDFTDSYKHIFFICMLLPLIVAGFSLKADNPQEEIPAKE